MYNTIALPLQNGPDFIYKWSQNWKMEFGLSNPSVLRLFHPSSYFTY